MTKVEAFKKEVQQLADMLGLEYTLEVEEPIVTFRKFYEIIDGSVLLWKNQIAVTPREVYPMRYFEVKHDNTDFLGRPRKLFMIYTKDSLFDVDRYGGALIFYFDTFGILQEVKIASKGKDGKVTDFTDMPISPERSIMDPEIHELVSDDFSMILKAAYENINTVSR